MSTYINIPLLNNFINTVVQPDICYAPEIHCTKEQGPFAYGLFPRGNGIIISKQLSKILNIKYLNKYKEKYPLTFNHDGFNMNLNQGYIDDGTIGYILCCYFIENNLDIFKHFKMFGMTRYEENNKNINNYLTIQFKATNNRNIQDEQSLATQIHNYMKNNNNDNLSFILEYLAENHCGINYNGISDINGIKYVLKYDENFNHLNKLNNKGQEN